jgi:xanthine/uracil permease
MVIFFIALLLLCFSISNLSTRIFVAIMSVLVGALIGWCIWLAWESTEEVDVWQDSLVVLRRTRATLFRRVKKIFNPFHIRRGRGDHFTMTNRLGDRV